MARPRALLEGKHKHADRVAGLLADKSLQGWKRLRLTAVSLGLKGEMSIADIAESESSTAPPSLSTRAGGTVPTQSGAEGAAKPVQPSYQARVRLEAVGIATTAGLRGQARIHTGSRPLAVRIWRKLSATFHFVL